MTKALLWTVLAACGPTTTSAAPPDEHPLEPSEDAEADDQHFCCSSVDLDHWTGQGCVAINKENINGCAAVLYCPGMWGKDGDTTKCAD